MNKSIQSIGLYSNNKLCLSDGCYKTVSLFENCEKSLDDLPVVLRQLLQDGYKPGDPCKFSVLNLVDNMNYYGAEASLEMLRDIRNRMRFANNESESINISFADIGSEFSGSLALWFQYQRN